jgi:urease beta subunit
VLYYSSHTLNNDCGNNDDRSVVVVGHHHFVIVVILTFVYSRKVGFKTDIATLYVVQ